MISMERGKYYIGGHVQGLAVPKREYVARTPKEVRPGAEGSWRSCFLPQAGRGKAARIPPRPTANAPPPLLARRCAPRSSRASTSWPSSAATRVRPPPHTPRSSLPPSPSTHIPPTPHTPLPPRGAPVHRAHYELFTRALHADNVGKDGVVLVHPTMGPTQDDDIPGLARTQQSLRADTHPRVFAQR